MLRELKRCTVFKMRDKWFYNDEPVEKRVSLELAQFSSGPELRKAHLCSAPSQRFAQLCL